MTTKNRGEKYEFEIDAFISLYNYFVAYPLERKPTWLVNLVNAIYHHHFLLPKAKISLQCNKKQAEEFSKAFVSSVEYSIKKNMEQSNQYYAAVQARKRGLSSQIPAIKESTRVYTVIFDDIKQLMSFPEDRDQEISLLALATIVRDPYPGPIVNLMLESRMQEAYKIAEKKFFEDKENIRSYLDRLDLIADNMQRARFENLVPGLFKLSDLVLKSISGKSFEPAKNNSRTNKNWVPRLPELEPKEEMNCICSIF